MTENKDALCLSIFRYAPSLIRRWFLPLYAALNQGLFSQHPHDRFGR